MIELYEMDEYGETIISRDYDKDVPNPRIDEKLVRCGISYIVMRITNDFDSNTKKVYIKRL